MQMERGMKKSAIAVIQQQLVEVMKNERAVILKETKSLSKEFGFTFGMLNGMLKG